MYLTLYKRCILSKDYTEVFDCTHRVQSNSNYSFFTRYLNSLNQRTYEIENVFITNEGSFNIPLEIANEDNIYEYNYMRLSYTNVNEHLLKTTRYCFIDNIEIRNDIAIISYTTDVWHTFSAYMYIRNSYLSRSRMLDFYNVDEEHIVLSPYNLPVEYDGNEKLEFNPLFTTSNSYNLFVKLQVYKTSNFGNPTERACIIGLLEDDSNNYNFTKQQITSIIQELIIESGTNHWKSNLTGITLDGAYVELANFYILPSSFEIGDKFKLKEGTTSDYVANTISTGVVEKYVINSIDSIYDGDFLTKSFTLQNNFKYRKIGTLFKNIDIVNNGTNFTGEFTAVFTKFDVTLFLNVQNQIVDLTEEFEIELPFTSVNGEVNAQNKMSRILGTMKDVITIGGNSLDFGRGGGLKSIYTDNSIKSNYSRTGRRRITSLKRNDITRTDYYKPKDMYSQGMDIGNNIIDVIKTNSPYYSSNYGTFGKTNGFTNAILGGLFLFIEDSDNDLYVQKSLDNIGYETYEITSRNIISLKETSIDSTKPFNTIKYDFINLYGDFPQDVCDSLKAILLDGVKVWYSENV